MRETRTLRAVAGAVALAALAAGMVAASGAQGEAKRGDVPVKLKVGKSKDGPFAVLTRINVTNGDEKTVWWRAANTTDGEWGTIIDGESNADGYGIKWFRGDNDITDEVRGQDGYEYNAKPNKNVFFRMTVRERPNSDPDSCYTASARIDMVSESFAAVGINDECNI